MTDSVIQFNYSDGVHLTSIYIKSDTHIDTFIPLLSDIIASMSRREKRSWGYIVVDIISLLRLDSDSTEHIKLIPETEDENCNIIFKHIISINEDYYKLDVDDLIDYITIESKSPMDNKLIFKSKLIDFKNQLTEEDTKYQIEKLEEEIKEKQALLNKLKNITPVDDIELRSSKQNEIMREWFEKRTGLKNALLNAHMNKIDEILNLK